MVWGENVASAPVRRSRRRYHPHVIRADQGVFSQLVTSAELQRAVQALLARTSHAVLPEQRRGDLIAAAGVALAGWVELDRDVEPFGAMDQSGVSLPHALAAWEKSSQTAQSLSPWARLLVSIFAQRRSANLGRTERPTRPGDLVDIFGINRMFHLELERQDGLRQALGLSTTVPRAVGLADHPDSPDERTLQSDYTLFAGIFALVESLIRRKAVWDRAVLPSEVIPPRLEMHGATQAVLTPWLFDAPVLEVGCEAIVVERERGVVEPRTLRWRLAESKRHLAVAGG